MDVTNIVLDLRQTILKLGGEPNIVTLGYTAYLQLMNELGVDPNTVNSLQIRGMEVRRDLKVPAWSISMTRDP